MSLLFSKLKFNQMQKKIPSRAAPVIDGLKSFFLKKGLLICWTIVLVALTSLSIYNAYWVIYDFVEDNKVTEVTVKPIRNVLPFVQSVSINYELLDKAVFPESWTMNETELDELLPWRPEGRPQGGEKITRLTKRTNASSFCNASGQLDLVSLVDITSINDIIFGMDHQFLQCATWTSLDPALAKVKNDVNDCTDYTGELRAWEINDTMRPRLAPVVDAFLEHGYGEDLVEIALSRVINGDYLGMSDHVEKKRTIADVPVTTIVDNLRPSGIQLTIPLDFIQHATTADSEPFFSILPLRFNDTRFAELERVDFWFGELPVISSTEMHNFFIRQYRTDGVLGAPSDQQQLFITFQNVAVYDSSETLGKEACAARGKLQTIADCVFKCKLDALVDQCHCRPFTYRRLYANDKERRTRPYCTNDLYKRCYKSGEYKPSACKEDAYIPCVMVDADYQILEDQEPRDHVEHRLNYRMVWDKSAYVVFEQKMQNSWTQMLGILGGNLGTFLSFSLLGVWKAIVFLIFYYRKKRSGKQRGTNSTVDDASAFVWSWLRFAQLEQHISGNNQQDDIQRQIEELGSKIDKLGEKYDDAKAENEKWKKAQIDDDEGSGNSTDDYESVRSSHVAVRDDQDIVVKL